MSRVNSVSLVHFIIPSITDLLPFVPILLRLLLLDMKVEQKKDKFDELK